jgi:hypothetical protein
VSLASISMYKKRYTLFKNLQKTPNFTHHLGLLEN